MSRSTEDLTVRVHAVRWEAESVLSYEFRRADGGDLPSFTAGAHIDLKLPNGLVRSYSLSGDQSDASRYVVGVNRDANSRGGSVWIHDNLRAGQLLQISRPLNDFELEEGAAATVLVAGGIGVTPILSMVRRLAALDRDWTLHLAVRNRRQAAFLEDLTVLAGDRQDRLRLHVDDEAGHVFDMAAAVATAPPGAHLYCCGPVPMLEAFEAATRQLPSAQRHVEYFTSTQEAATDGGFEVELTKSGLTLAVVPGSTILDAMLDAGVDAAYSCTEGICGTCETRVVEGVPDHRDMVLTDEEKESNQIIMVCCSGSRSARLVLEA